MRIETTNLIIREMTLNDLEEIHLVLSDPEVMRHIEPPFSREATSSFILSSALREKPMVFAVVETQTCQVIGQAIYHRFDEESFELGWILARKHWGKGYANEMTQALISHAQKDPTIRSLVIECDPAQLVTKHIAEKHGFGEVSSNDRLIQFRLEIKPD